MTSGACVRIPGAGRRTTPTGTNKILLAKQLAIHYNVLVAYPFWKQLSGTAYVIPDIWPDGQVVKTPPSHGGIRGSTPLRAVSIVFLKQAILSHLAFTEIARFLRAILFCILGI